MQAALEAVWVVVSHPDWYWPAAVITFAMGFCIAVVGSMRDIASFGYASLFGVTVATCVATDPFEWGQWRLLLLLPALVLAFGAILLVVGVQMTMRRWWRVMRGRPTQADARTMVAKALKDRRRAAEVCDALSRAPGDFHADYYQYFVDWPGKDSTVTPRTAVRWLRAGEPADRLWQMLCLNMSEDRIVGYLDGTNSVDWPAVEMLAALRSGKPPVRDRA